jgi:hypothetical protein
VERCRDGQVVRVTIGVLAPALLLLAACAAEPGSESPPAGDGLSTVPPPIRTPPSPKLPSDLIRPVRVTGVVERGSHGCVVLVSATVRWVLLGEGAQALAHGARVQVSGRAAPQVRTACDGESLRVREIREL